VLAILEE